MSALFFKRFLTTPFQIASIIPSSKAMVKRVASKIDFSGPRIIAEYGPGEGVHSREIARRMAAGFSVAPVRAGSGLFPGPANASLRTIRASTSSTAMPRVCRRNCERRGIRTAITSFPEFLSAFSRSKRNAPCSQKTYDALRRAAALHHLPGDERAAAARHTFRSGGVRICSAKYSADVHHGFS